MVIKRSVKPLERAVITFITEDAGFSTPLVVTTIRKALFHAQIVTMNDLIKLTLYELRNLKGIGEKSCDELIKAMLRNKIDCRFVRDAKRRGVV